MRSLRERWLALDLLDDPLHRTQARLLQRFAIVMLAATLLSIPVSFIAQSAVERLTGALTSTGLVVLLVSALVFLARGRLLLAGLLIIISTAAAAGLNMATTGLEGSRAVFVLLVLPIVLGGLLGDRRLLVAALALSAIVPAGIIVGERAAPGLVATQPDTYDPLLTFVTFVLGAGVLTMLVGYFGSALQDALRAALGRERELEALGASLELQVAERTLQLTHALDEVRAQSAAQATLLETLEQQRTTIRELSIPILPLSANTLVIPLVGALDHDRLHDLLSRALSAVEQSQARALLLDVTGVPVVDTFVASGIVSVGRAARLLGASVTLIGVRPEVAQTMVALGVELGDIRTAPDMASVLAEQVTNSGRLKDEG
jgi:rsbT co-antagonist protein RsbR